MTETARLPAGPAGRWALFGIVLALLACGSSGSC